MGLASGGESILLRGKKKVKRAEGMFSEKEGEGGLKGL